MPSFDFSIETQQGEWVNVSDKVRTAAALSRIEDGLCVIDCPYLDAAVVISDSDEAQAKSMEREWDGVFKNMPQETAARLKAAMLGGAKTILIEHGKLFLRREQAVYLCEFGQAQERMLFIKVVGS
ncbi:Uncharacterized conserved protein [uncultured Ruminococcus sp.]|uniref:YjbQ family protein n=1 Tax=Massiliimalia timonensis TaxID=1987501 RepID=A0A8J6PBX7_9FIRM|nr:YjbQ family protein [Massiliimalia timonensis]MBC8610598.1 YjbQ family protein [Massiliimalia timonensis]SCH91032.1 Uncharacterized conserved protein [uncultured Clostridium sp.]SCI23920.1 Uncharacterized conserved protein [uncultured Ruminococcus sp.]